MQEDCDCEKSEMVNIWPDERDVGDRFLRVDETPLVSSIRDNILMANVNPSAVFNRKMNEDRLDNLDIENVVVDYSFVEDEEEDETLVSYEIPEDEEETTNYEDEEETTMGMTGEEPESEDDLEGEVEEVGERQIEIQDPEILETRQKFENKNKVSDYLDDFM